MFEHNSSGDPDGWKEPDPLQDTLNELECTEHWRSLPEEERNVEIDELFSDLDALGSVLKGAEKTTKAIIAAVDAEKRAREHYKTN